MASRRSRSASVARASSTACASACRRAASASRRAAARRAWYASRSAARRSCVAASSDSSCRARGAGSPPRLENDSGSARVGVAGNNTIGCDLYYDSSACDGGPIKVVYGSGFWSGVVCEATVTLGAYNVTNYKFGAYQQQRALPPCAYDLLTRSARARCILTLSLSLQMSAAVVGGGGNAGSAGCSGCACGCGAIAC